VTRNFVMFKRQYFVKYRNVCMFQISDIGTESSGYNSFTKRMKIKQNIIADSKLNST
jgi:hypothetical protein